MKNEKITFLEKKRLKQLRLEGGYLLVKMLSKSLSVNKKRPVL